MHVAWRDGIDAVVLEEPYVDGAGRRLEPRREPAGRRLCPDRSSRSSGHLSDHRRRCPGGGVVQTDLDGDDLSRYVAGQGCARIARDEGGVRGDGIGSPHRPSGTPSRLFPGLARRAPSAVRKGGPVLQSEGGLGP